MWILWKSDTVRQSWIRNYKVFANVGTQPGIVTNILSILDTGAEPDHVRNDVLNASLTIWIRHKYLQHIHDARKQRLKRLGAFDLAVQFTSCYRQVNFFVCNSLAAPIILCAGFCDTFLQGICPGHWVVELEDVKTVLIISHGLQGQQ